MKSGVKKWLSRMNIRKKLVIYSYLFITPILLVISVFIFSNNYKELVESETKECIRTVDNLSSNTDALLTNITDLGTYISINDEIIKILKAADGSEYSEDSQVWFHEAPMKIIQDMVALNGQLKTVAIYPENGVLPYLRCMDYSAYLDEIEQVRQTETYKFACEKVGKFVWKRVEKNDKTTYNYNQNVKIVAYREMYDLTKKNKLGYLVLGASTGTFDENCNGALRNENESVFVFSSFGDLLSSAGSLSFENAKYIIEKNPQNLKKGITAKLETDGYMIYCKLSETTGTITYKFVPSVAMNELINNLIWSDVLLLLGLMIGFFPILILISSVITKPLGKLRNAMTLFKKGDFGQRVEITSNDEVGEVSQVFNDMVSEMKELIDNNYVLALKEKESELNALQAQINPHFLYNALDSLYWKCVDAGNDEIGEDILSLSDLFRLVLNRGNSIIPVSDEIKLLESYLHLQAARFGKRFSYRFDVDEAVLDENIPKLILQPFVENAVVHGFEKSNEHFTLDISAHIADGNIVFKIVDTGVGMSREQVENLWSHSEEVVGKGQRIGKYAIRNVRERLEILYHNKFTLNIDSREGAGTTVTLVIPSGRKGY